ncbi:MAG: oligoendopeptidase F [Myxococcota bacterium]
MWSWLASVAFAAETEASWRLEDIYPTVEAFDAAKTKVAGEFPKVAACEGKLGADAATLLGCLEAHYAVSLELSRLASYTSNHASADTRDDAWAEREGGVNLLRSEYAEVLSYFDPELLALGSERIEGFLKAEPRLAPYAYPLRSTLRQGEHVKSPAEERLLALATAVTYRPGETYTTFANAELPWPTLTLPDGSKTRLAQPDYSRLRSNPDPMVRKLVFDSFFGTLASYEATIGEMLGAQIASHWFLAQARGYPSCVEASLARDFVPRGVYDTLVAEANANLPTLHRYLKLRGKMLGIEQLTYADLYVPLVASDRKFDLAESERLALASAKPLGPAYVAAMQQGFAGGWIDVYPREGKVGGAYMSDEAYGTHPFVLLNHNDDYESASTLAHEFGHAMHSHLAMGHQPYATAGYSTFLAEIASTFNEALLLDHVLKGAKTDEEKLFFLGSALEQLRTTFFRQAMFAEYELAIHAQAERGEPVTGSTLTATYADIVRRYHGHDQGVVRVDDVWTHEWSFVPHFYYDFYVFQYATSLAASSLLAEDVLNKKKGAVDRYLGLLSAGGSDDPYVLLKGAGVDLASPEPYRAVVARMNAIMDQIEVIEAKRAKKSGKK